MKGWSLAVGILAFSLSTACSNPQASVGASPAPSSAFVSPTPSVSPTPPPPHTALAVVKALVRDDPNLEISVTFNAANDPNHLLGRPNGYVSKTAFTSRKINQSQFVASEKGTVDEGGSVEYFRNQQMAVARARYIQGYSVMLADGYDYAARGVLLRLSGRILPNEAHRLGRDLGVIMHAHAQGPIT